MSCFKDQIQMEQYKKIQLFTENFKDNFETKLITLYNYLGKNGEISGKTETFSIGSETIMRPKLARKKALQTLENTISLFGANQNKYDIERWLNDVNSMSLNTYIVNTILAVSFDIFQSFEKLFMKSSDGKIKEFAFAIADKLIKYCLMGEENSNFDRRTITELIITRKSFDDYSIIYCCNSELFSKLWTKQPDQTKNKQIRHFTLAGLLHGDKILANDKCKIEKYGYRRILKSEQNAVFLKDAKTSSCSPAKDTYQLTPENEEFVVDHVKDYLRKRNLSDLNTRINHIRNTIQNDICLLEKDYHIDVLKELVDEFSDLKKGRKIGKESNYDPGTPGGLGGSGNKITTVSHNASIGTINMPIH